MTISFLNKKHTYLKCILFGFLFFCLLIPSTASAIISDDFNHPNLDTTIWSYIDPIGDASLSLSGAGSGDANLLLSLPAGQSHDIWTAGNFAPRITQPVEDGDFSAEAKFDSLLNTKYQLQGILVEGESGNFLRFDFVHDGTGLKLFAASFLNGTPTTRYSEYIQNSTTLYLRVKRTGSSWVQEYSYDGFNWQTGAMFSHTMMANSIGVFAGNAGGSPPEFTSVIDYFFSEDTPIDPEDGTVTTDTTPPYIYNIKTSSSDTQLIVSWKTDEPAIGSVDYGMSESLELGTIVESSLTNSHEIVISDLQPDTTYNFRISSKDSPDNTSQSPIFVSQTDSSTTSDCTINVWHGDYQVFGALGIPQKWVNILGNIEGCPDNVQLSYKLNDGSFSQLTIGPDNRRLASPGDFNAEISYNDLMIGTNQVVVEVRDQSGLLSSKNISVEYMDGNYWPETYSIDWSSTTSIQDVAQIVDGDWILEANSIHPAVPGYDRLVAIGDIVWQDYEVTVPITVHGNYPRYGYGSGVGLLMRWKGHYNWEGEQPNEGWWPMGALGWYRWQDDADVGKLIITGSDGSGLGQDYSGKTLDIGTNYIFKMRVETQSDGNSLYSLKFWPESDPEPTGWDISELNTNQYDTGSGSILLVAHYVDASFGDVSIVPLSSNNDTAPPTISAVTETVGSTQATITWETDEPATSWVSFGQTSGYENGRVGSDNLTGTHSVTLTGLSPETQYHYQINSVDSFGNSAYSADLVFTTSAESTTTVTSDDFNISSLDTAVWSFVDPVGGGSVTMTGTQAAISVPAGVSHDVWTKGNDAPRIMQAVADSDFEIEAKFDSPVTLAYQLQGILVQANADNFLRFGFYSDGNSTRLFSASIQNGSASVKINTPINDGAPLYMRVVRSGDQWTQYYSYDGNSWLTGADFSLAMIVTEAGVYAGNAGSNPPAHTALIDYFQLKTPTTTGYVLNIDVVGSGSIQVNPDQQTYSSGETVELTAVADSGWSFSEWSGTSSGTSNPFQVVMSEDQSITATFIAQTDTTPPVLSNISAGTPGSDQATITWETDEPATSWVSFGPTTGYESGSVGSDNLTGTHSVTLTGLYPEVEYHYQVYSVDSSGNAAYSADLVFTTSADSTTAGTYDGFNTSSLDTALWSFVDPVGDGSVTMTGTQAAISVPAGVSHDVWTKGNDAPRIMQAVADSDFEIEAKFDSPVTLAYQLQGILVQANADNFLRFGFYSDGNSTRLFSASIQNGSASVKINTPINDGAPLYMRVVRSGDQWTQYYSYDGNSWLTGADFSLAMIVTEAGVYAGNAGSNPPAHTALIDYFQLKTPTTTGYVLNIDVVGSGSIQVNPDQQTYSSGETVELTAVADSGWSFSEWSGTSSGTSNPFQVVMSEDQSITATFIAQTDTTPPVLSNISAGTPGSDQATITWETDEPATSWVSFGPTTGYESGSVGSDNLTGTHSVTLTGLYPEVEYHYQVYSVDSSGNAAYSADLVFTTSADSITAGTYDGFNTSSLDTALWSFVDPVGDGSVTMTGTQAAISVPAGVSHDVWTKGNDAPRIMQAVADSDFEIEAKFDSTVTSKYQLQGILVQTDADNFLRFGFYSDGSSTRLFSASLQNGSASVKINTPINDGAHLYMRVVRSGDQWTQYYSYDGSSWLTGADFSLAMIATEVGVYAGNAGSNAPAHTALIDYFEFK